MACTPAEGSQTKAVAAVANHKSAEKAYAQSLRRREQNRQFRTRLRHALKSIRTAFDQDQATKAQEAWRETVSLIDRMAGKGIIHRNAAARYKSRIATRLAKRPSQSA